MCNTIDKSVHHKFVCGNWYMVPIVSYLASHMCSPLQRIHPKFIEKDFHGKLYYSSDVSLHCKFSDTKSLVDPKHIRNPLHTSM